MNADPQRWDIWCQNRGIDPNTSDETIFDAFLHGTEPNPPNPFTAQMREWAAQKQMREWAAQNGVTPLAKPSLRYLGTVRSWNEQQSQVDLGWRDDAQREWYAACEAFSAAYQRFPLSTRKLQDRAEVCELERLYLLPSSSSGEEPTR